MNLEHAVQHSLNVSRVRLHTNKPAGTRGVTSTWLISTLSRLYNQNREPKERVYLHLWTLETLSSYLRQLRVLVLQRGSAV